MEPPCTLGSVCSVLSITSPGAMSGPPVLGGPGNDRPRLAVSGPAVVARGPVVRLQDETFVQVPLEVSVLRAVHHQERMGLIVQTATRVPETGVYNPTY